MVATACPTTDELKNYTLGRLSQQDWAAIAEHLESCRQCQAAIATVDDVADTLVTQLREPEPGDSFLNESQCEAALKRARDIEQSKSPVPFFNAKEFGEYRILEELGQGGMGAVYKALHTKLDRVVAIKILSRGRSGDQRAIARFEREMKAVGRFDYPHIVRAYDAREIEGSPVLIMEFVEGMDLGRLVQRLGPLPIADACELVRQACLGLQYVHQQGLVHRDIKPSNLMLTPQGIVKILDLGLARFHFEQSEEEMTNSGQAMGTADYMAPEQASDSHAVDIRADIYSLGCTLYKLLAGCAPFEGSQYKGTFEKMTAHVQRPAPPIENLLPLIPRELADVVDKMLAKNPADRYAQPADVIEALTPLCANAALTALLKCAAESKTESPLSLRERARVRADQVEDANRPATHPTRRRTSILAAIGLLLFVLGFGFGYSLGIIVTIKKDGKTTTVKVPEGSNVHVNEQGNVAVDLMGGKEQKQSDYHRIDLSTGSAKAAVPPEPYAIWPGDSLVIRGIGTLLDQPIDGTYVVEPEGTVPLPPAHGRVYIQGLSLAEAEKAITTSLQNILRNPEVSVTLSSWIDRSKPQPPTQPHHIAPGDKLDIWAEGTLLDQPVQGSYLVESDGQVTLGPDYGRVNLKGQTFHEAEHAMLLKLGEILKNPEVSLTLDGWRKVRKPTQKEEEQIHKAYKSKKVAPKKEEQAEPKPSGQILPGLPGEKAEATKEEKRD